MKTEIHPEYAETTVTCSCGNTFTTRSTKPDTLRVELCNECHPFFTGTQKLVDTGGRVERFNRRYGRKTETPAAASSTSAEQEATTETESVEETAEETAEETTS
ncbi:MAG: 50S ribosomal protein L31 [Acidimicrobiia bacterium]|nr:50S ribosomal protein L31 [Acidimicrobiia bacterium]